MCRACYSSSLSQWLYGRRSITGLSQSFWACPSSIGSSSPGFSWVRSASGQSTCWNNAPRRMSALERASLNLDLTATTIFVALFLLVAWLGFAAARWRKADLNLLHEWGLGGRRFGTIVTWFLLGGDLYTAYNFIAVPALVFGAGATGFFALPYTVLIYPFAFVVFPKLWAVAKRHGYVTAADFVHARYNSRMLALAVAV